MSRTAERLFDAVPSDKLNHLPDFFEETQVYNSSIFGSDGLHEDATVGVEIHPDPAVANSGLSLVAPPPGVSNTVGSSASYTTSAPQAGTYCIVAYLADNSWWHWAWNQLVPVTPGATYATSHWVRATADNSYPSTTYMTVYWYDVNGNYISYSTTGYVYFNSSNNNVWTQASGAVVAPANATQCRVGGMGNRTSSNGNSYYDTLSLKKISPWVGVQAPTISNTTAVFRSGARSLSIVSTQTSPWSLYRSAMTGSNGMVINEHAQYDIKSYFRPAVVVNRSVRYRIVWNAANGTNLGETVGPWVALNSVAWHEVGGLVSPPAGAARMDLRFDIDATASGETFYMDDVTVQQTSNWVTDSNVGVIDREDVRIAPGSTRSMKITPAGAGDIVLSTLPQDNKRFAVIAGVKHLLAAQVDSDAVRNFELGMRWYDKDNLPIGSTQWVPVGATDGVDWVAVAAYLEAPADAVTATFHVKVVAAGAAETFYLDEPSVSPIMYSVPDDGSVEQVVVKQILFVNVGSNATNVNFVVTPAFAAIEPQNYYLKDLVLPPGKVLPYNLSQVLEPGEQVIITSSVADSLAVHASGIVELA